MMESNVTLGTRLDRLATDLTGFYDAIAGEVADFRRDRREPAPGRKLVNAVADHPTVAILVAIGIGMLAVRALRRR